MKALVLMPLLMCVGALTLHWRPYRTQHSTRTSLCSFKLLASSFFRTPEFMLTCSSSLSQLVQQQQACGKTSTHRCPALPCRHGTPPAVTQPAHVNAKQVPTAAASMTTLGVTLGAPADLHPGQPTGNLMQSVAVDYRNTTLALAQGGL